MTVTAYAQITNIRKNWANDISVTACFASHLKKKEEANHHNNFSDFKMGPFIFGATANVTITVKITKVNNIQTVLRAFIPVFTAVTHILGGRKVFLIHSNTGVSQTMWINACLGFGWHML